MELLSLQPELSLRNAMWELSTPAQALGAAASGANGARQRVVHYRFTIACSPTHVPIVTSPPRRLQSGMNLQICFVNDSGSDKDSDADDSKTETSLDTPLSPMVGLVAHLTEHVGHNED